jgi:hypothetical protein
MNNLSVVARYIERFRIHRVSTYLSRLFTQGENNDSRNVSSFYSSDNAAGSCKTLGQICLLQLAFYLSITATLCLLLSMLGFPVEDLLGQLFSYQVWKSTTAQGFLVPCAYLFNSIWMAGWLLCIVKRAKKCLDFAVTMYLLHFVFCTVFYGFPYSWSWWLFLLLQVSITTLLGEWLCMRRELQEILLVPCLRDEEAGNIA